MAHFSAAAELNLYLIPSLPDKFLLSLEKQGLLLNARQTQTDLRGFRSAYGCYLFFFFFLHGRQRC